MKDFTNGREGKLILHFATPMLLGNLFQQLYNIVDSWIVGQFIGDTALGAVGASSPVFFALVSFAIGISLGGTVVISQYFGAKNIENVKKAIGTLYIFFFFAAIIITIVGILFSKQIFRLIHLPEAMIPQATVYFNTYIAGSILLFGFNGTSAILRGLGDSKTPLYFLIIASIFNVVFDFLFVGVFNWGIRGVAIATVMSHGGAFITAVFYLNKKHKIIQFRVRELKFTRKIFKQAINIGLPTGFQQTFVSIGLIALYRIVNNFSDDVVTAYSVAYRIDMFAILPSMSLSQALAAFVGQNIGAKKLDRVRSGLRATFFIGSFITVLASIFIIVLRYPLMEIFTDTQNVVKVGQEYLLIIPSFYIIFSSMFCVNGVLRGAGDTFIPMIITLLSLWLIRIPVALFLSKIFGETGVWWATPISWTFGLLLSFGYFLTGRWKLKSIITEKI